MKEKIKKFLAQNKVEFLEGNMDFSATCPFCDYTDALGKKMAVFNINKETGKSECYQCGIKKEFPEFAEKIGGEWIETTESMASTSQSVGTTKLQGQNFQLRLWSVSEIMSRDFGEQSWVVDQLIPIEAVTILSGNPQNFKTWLTIEIAKCVSLGTSFIKKFPTTQGAVLIIDEEDHIRHIKDRLKSLEIPNEAPIYYLSQMGIKIDDNRWLNNILTLAKEKSIKLIILDSLIRIHSQEENDAGGMSHVFERIKEFTKNGITILVTHHHRKEGFGTKNPSQSMRGSTDIGAAVDCHLSVEMRDGRLLIHQNKLRVAKQLKPFSITIDFSENEKLTMEYGGEIAEKEHKSDAVKEVILEILKDGEQTREEINMKAKSSVNVGKNAIFEALKGLELDELITVRMGDSNKKFYSLPATD
ncbi:MAG: AAA family ATPase [bacterium]|nr:AAA family ATPase [bacterium]